MEIEKKQRIDQWLWHVRFYKTRFLASKAIVSGHVTLDDSNIKKNHTLLKPGSKVKFSKGNSLKEVEIIRLTKRRISPKEVSEFYIDHSKENEESDSETFHKTFKKKPLRIGKLNKKERRLINHFKERNI
tara:strand:- start:240 stop:629 length:390 start_codon:yes stop_codon:yes gene_type:complete